MKITWEEIYNNSSIKNCSYFEATYRAKVIGGWLIRHETCSDYQYSCLDSCGDNPSHPHGHIDEEGYQDVKNEIIFLRDPTHMWDEWDKAILGEGNE